ncbi:trypsin-like peptidase domain-containing protein [Maribacter sp. 2210JD10-5]|uniref:trypsin-like peptidase domain-containing protein n=1 Tax=Maribacter sp. 2210JD10-5 TaxID=3386272 RepID=UPI0039BC376E
MIVVTVITLILISCSSTKKLNNTPIALINNVSYQDSSFDNSNASNSFLVAHEGNTYAITAKHILMIAKTDAMKFVDFEGGLKQWKMHPKNDSTKFIVADKLLNANRKDSLTWDYMDTNWDTYEDWLVFSVKENKTDYTPLSFRKKPLKKGEHLYAIGWTYKDTVGSQRMYEYKFDTTKGNFHSLIQINGPNSMGGLSGAPVVDNKGKIVGLVSSGGEDENTKEVLLQATDIKNAFEFISNMK